MPKEKKGVVPHIEPPTRETFNTSYGRISNTDWNTYGAEMAIWLAGYKYAENKIKSTLLKQQKEQSKNNKL
jgi:hypothetical protein